MIINQFEHFRIVKAAGRQEFVSLRLLLYRLSLIHLLKKQKKITRQGKRDGRNYLVSNHELHNYLNEGMNYR